MLSKGVSCRDPTLLYHIYNIYLIEQRLTLLPLVSFLFFVIGIQ
jgi:hypothetical protein